MKLSDLIIQYRQEHHLSQRQFALQCGVSNGYISMIENGVNPKTGQPMVPSMQHYAKIAKGMHTTINDLFSMIDDAPVSLKTETPASDRSGLAEEFMELFVRLHPDEQRLIVSQIKGILSSR